tara:strand:- start:3295 stop:4674 length:1380 start_codon:yes stop_codon:yes gene_type:complete
MEQSSQAIVSGSSPQPTESQIPDLVKIGSIESDTVVDVETSYLEPVQHSQTTCRFRLENKGILHSNSKLVFSMTNPISAQQCYFPVGVGIFSLIKSARISSGGKTISEVQDTAHLTSYESMFLSPEHNAEREIYTTARLLNRNLRYETNTSGALSRGLYIDTLMDYSDRFSEYNIPGFLEASVESQFQINLSDLFGFLKFQQLPLYMMNEQVTIDLEFNPSADRMFQTAAGTNTFNINTTETKLIADYIYFPQSMMEAYANANRNMTMTYMAYRLSKQTIDAGTSLKIRNIGGNGRIVTKVIAGLQDESLTGVTNPLLKYTSQAPGGANASSNGSITLNVKYNNHLLYPIDVDNYAQHQHNTAQAQGMVPFVSRYEYCGEGTDVSFSAENFAESNMRSVFKGSSCWQAHRLNRNERVNSRGIEYQATYNTNGGNRTSRIYLETVRMATLSEGKFTIVDA